MKPKKRPAANVSRMSIRTWKRKGRKRMDFSHLLDFKLFVKPYFKIFCSHLMAKSSAAASSAMRAEYPAVASKKGEATFEK